jgi:very-short-patch-repair endonuclease
MKKRFDEHPRSVYWSPRNETRPSDVALNSHKEFWFNCPDCHHEFKASPHAVVNAWCGYCNKKRLCNSLDCQFCYNNSFSSSEKAKYWSDRNHCNPMEVFKYSSKKYWFNCEECNHEFESDLGHVKETWCPYCANKKLCEYPNCFTCFNNSFASEEKAIYWSNQNEIPPRNVFKVSKKKYIFICEICNLSFDKRLDHISNSKSWCPNCFNKTETKLFKYLKQSFDVLKNVKYDWCKSSVTNRKLEYDFVIPELRLIIELDGRQHFQQISNWKCPVDQLVSDVYKTNCANENGYKVIRLLQEEVLYNDSDWLDANLRPYLTLQNDNIFITNNEKYKSIYDQHKQCLRGDSALERVRLDRGVQEGSNLDLGIGIFRS